MSKDVMKRFASFSALLVAAVVGLAGCEQKGPAEKAGENLDKAGQNIKDAVIPPGPGEKVGRAVDKVVKP